MFNGLIKFDVLIVVVQEEILLTVGLMDSLQKATPMYLLGKMLQMSISDLMWE